MRRPVEVTPAQRPQELRQQRVDPIRPAKAFRSRDGIEEGKAAGGDREVFERKRGQARDHGPQAEAESGGWGVTEVGEGRHPTLGVRAGLSLQKVQRRAKRACQHGARRIALERPLGGVRGAQRQSCAVQMVHKSVDR